MSSLGPLALVLACGAIAAGCGASGAKGSPPGNSAGGANATGGGNVGGNGQVIDPAVFVPAEAGLRRLTLPQYRSSLADLFGAAALPATEFESDGALSGFASIAAARLAVSAAITEEFETAALEVAHKALSDTAGRAALLGCTPAGVTDNACTSQFFTKLGRRAWRRPLTTDEVSALTNLVAPIQTGLKDYFAGLEYGVAALLESPHFLYREEIGTPDPSNPALAKFSDYELGTRLSFFLWNTTPDDALLDAADAKKLTTTDGFGAQVTRLLASPRATDAVKNFFTEYFRLAELESLSQLPSQYPQNTATIGPAMREETATFMASIALGQSDYRSMFDSRDTFVNAELAQLYGLPAPAGAGFVKVTLPDSGMRAGFLGQASFLALNSHATGTSPTRRGKFIQEMLRCQTLPPPPPNVPPLPNDASSASQTMRQKLEIHRQVEPCKTCHAAMDPMGLAFENFDAMGVLRTTEVGQTIDASGELGGQAFSGPRELEALLRQDAAVGQCAARNLYRYALGHVEGVQGNEQPAIDQIVKAFEGSQYQFTALIQAVVTSPAFTTAATPSQTLPAGQAGMGGSGAGGSAAAGGSAPAGGMGNTGGTGMAVANPTFAKDIAPIIAANCEPCHTAQAKAGFNWNYDNLVTNSTITSPLAGTCKYIDAAHKRVVPRDPDHSLMWVKLAIDEHQSTANGCGDHMPQAPSPHVLTTAQLDTIRAWIVQGALP
jgi:Protein of unknown function (DUF1592)/Protein of unknown function (DUF1588)/Protein of unknown function (DUF1585)/Protein of unknown function (DUF1595)/Protein of unknown function (DUF1587)